MRFGLALLILVLAVPAWAEKLPLAEISDYLNKLRTAEGEFTQINDDGTISTGNILIKRPGRMRFEYNEPDDALVIVASGEVVIVDKRSNQLPEVYPLRRTPLSIILARTVNLDQEAMVTGHSFDGTATVVEAQDPQRPEVGSIQMLFTADPVELRQWVIKDGDGFTTTVVLGAITTGRAIANSNFDASEYRNTTDR